MSEVPQLLTVQQTAEVLGCSESGVRHRLFHDVDGLDSRAAVRLGRSVRIRADRLAEIIEEKTGAAPFAYSYTKRPGRPSKDAA